MSVRRFTVTETREVMEVTSENLDEVASWCGGKIVWAPDADPRPSYVHYQTHKGDIVGGPAEPGDVLVRDPRGLRNVSREEFERDLLPGWTEETT